MIIDANRTFIIAEAGVNHNGSLELALKLIDAAKAAGADAVKFQTFKAENLVTKQAAKAGYQKETTDAEESQFRMLKRLELNANEHKQLAEYCKSKDIIFMSTPFDFESVDLLERLDVPVYKVSSGDLTNMPLLKYIASKQKFVIISTGMAGLKEVEEAIQWISDTGNNRIVLMQCTTSYPTPYSEVNLNAILTLKNTFNLPVGYSDHTLGIEVAIAATALGASIIEKHFTLDRHMDGPDHKASLEPQELAHMVKTIRNIECSMGDGVKAITSSELHTAKVAKKSIVSACRIKKGSIISKDCIMVKRPATGIEPKFFEELSKGYIALVDIEQDTPIQWDMIAEVNA